MKNLAAITCIHYSVDLTLKQFMDLSARDELEQDRNRSCDLDSILTGLTYARTIEFNGHFGAAVFFSLEYEHISEAETVAKMIKMYATKKTLDAIFEVSVGSKYSHRGSTRGISPFESAIGRYKSADGSLVNL